MLIPYDDGDSAEFYDEFYRNQVGNGLSVFKGKLVMDGNGKGSIFSGLMRAVTPLAKSAAKNLGKRLLSTGARVVSDVVRGKGVKDSLKRRFKASGTDLLGDVTRALLPDSVKGEEPTPRKRRRTVPNMGRRKNRRQKTIF